MTAEPQIEQPHALYRFYSDTGQLLYVGITSNPSARFPQHQKSKTWWHDVAGISVEKHGTRADALAAEARAIRIEKPLRNITHNDLHSSRQESGWDAAERILATSVHTRYEVTILLTEGELAQPLLQRIRDTLTAHPGRTPVRLSVTHDGFATRLYVDPSYYVSIDPEALQALRALVGQDRVIL